MRRFWILKWCSYQHLYCINHRVFLGNMGVYGGARRLLVGLLRLVTGDCLFVLYTKFSLRFFFFLNMQWDKNGIWFRNEKSLMQLDRDFLAAVCHKDTTHVPAGKPAMARSEASPHSQTQSSQPCWACSGPSHSPWASLRGTVETEHTKTTVKWNKQC